MDRELAARLAMAVDQPTSLSEFMEFTNRILENNNGDHVNGFPTVDIQFTKVIEHLNLTERERDILYISNSFSPLYQFLHVDVGVLHRTPNEQESQQLHGLYTCLKKYNIEHLLVNKLNNKTLLKAGLLQD